jgi:hypothetical protein
MLCGPANAHWSGATSVGSSALRARTNKVARLVSVLVAGKVSRACVDPSTLNKNSSQTTCSMRPPAGAAVGTSMRSALLAAGKPGIQPLHTTV